jgi:predicted DNA-binding transcriptional regulator YafY
VYHPTTRLLTLLELLQAAPQLSGGELARRLEVDVRTVRRYVRNLQDMGVPIEATTGRAGGYRLLPGFKLPPLMLSDDEAVAVMLGLLLVDRLGIAGGVAASAGAAAKIKRVLPIALRERVGALAATLVFDLPHGGDQVTRTVLATLASAAQQERQVALVYRSAVGATSERALDPYGIVFSGGHWYAVGHCHLRGELRILRLDRIVAATLLPMNFSRPATFDSHAFLVQRIADIPDRWDVSVLLELDLAAARRQLPPTLVRLEAVPPFVRMRAAIDDLGLVARLLAGLGCPFVIEQPAELRATVRELAAALAQAAEQTAPSHLPTAQHA